MIRHPDHVEKAIIARVELKSPDGKETKSIVALQFDCETPDLADVIINAIHASLKETGEIDICGVVLRGPQ